MFKTLSIDPAYLRDTLRSLILSTRQMNEQRSTRTVGLSENLPASKHRPRARK